MKVKLILLVICVMLLPVGLSCSSTGKGRYRWAVHDMNRPRPPIVTPAEQPGQPPSNAIVLFDGRDLSQWVSEKDAGQAKWKVKNGYMEVVKKTGDIRTKRSFGDCQLHVEWACPAKGSGIGQHHGNSGVFLMGRYEVQIVNSYENETYADGQAAAMYGQYPPMVNACLPPGRWQSYDIIFRRPRFNKGGRVIRPARITVLHNGVLVHDNAKLRGATVHKKRAKYEAHGDKLPLKLQEHGDPVRYRNIWIIELPEKSALY